MAILITKYGVDPVANTVVVAYGYNIQDTVANQPIPRLNDAVLSQTVPPLDAPNWSDTDLCNALATFLGQPQGSVEMATPS
jgi:hypothetical protein